MKLTILGASGHGRVVADIAKLIGYDSIEFLDDNLETKNCGEYPVVGKCIEASKKKNDIFVAIGNASVRKEYMQLLNNKLFPLLIHPNTTIADDVIIGKGTVVMAGSVINTGSQIGKGCIINTCSSVDHDCIISDYVHVSVGAHISGTVKVGEKTWLGAGVIVSNNINICNDCILGTGAVVVKDIVNPGTYIGVPAKLLERMK